MEAVLIVGNSVNLNNFDFKGYQLLKLETFTDMLEIRDTIRQPILMKENHDKTVDFVNVPDAQQYRETVMIRRKMDSNI